MNNLVDFTTAKLLKEKGFDKPVIKCYRVDGILSSVYNCAIPENINNYGYKVTPNVYPHPPYYSAPTIAEVVMWLYEKYQIWIVVNIDIQDRWYFELFNLKAKRNAEVLVDVELWFNSPTEAYSKAIGYILNNLI